MNGQAFSGTMGKDMATLSNVNVFKDKFKTVLDVISATPPLYITVVLVASVSTY